MKTTAENVLTGEEACSVWGDLMGLGSYKDGPRICGIFKDQYTKTKKKCFTAFDNTSGECFTESFNTLSKAVEWVSEA